MLASVFSVAKDLGYPALAAFVAVEALGVPLPGETAVIFAGLAAAAGRLDIVLVIAVAAAAAIIGDNIGFQIGRRGGRRLLERPGRFAQERRRVLEIGDPFFERHGGKAVFLGRWITGLRVWTSWLAGASDMSWPTFLLWNALGGIAWSASVALAAYYGGNGVKRVFEQIGLYGIPVALVVFALFAMWWWRRRRARPRFGIINFANSDMVGHTGVIAAAVIAVEVVDECLGEVVAAVHETGGVCIVTADHGNSDDMLTPDGEPQTAHSLNRVPLIVTSSAVALEREGILADVAPTALELLGIPVPAEMTGRSLL